MEQNNADFVEKMTGVVDCEMPPILNQYYNGNAPGIRNAGCALCCGINLASFKKGKRYTIAEFAGHYSSGVDGNNRAYVSYNWTAPDGVSFAGPISLVSLSEAATIARIRRYVNQGIPVACHATGSGGKEHWFVAYHADDNGGDTWQTSNLYVLDPFNGVDSSYYGRNVPIWNAMDTSNVRAGIDKIRLLA